MPPETTEKPERATTSGDAAAGPSAEDRDETPSRPPPSPPAVTTGGASGGRGGPGFFTIHKKGQGYWTRMGTAAGALLLGALTAYNLYAYLPLLLHMESTPAGVARERQIAAGVAAGFFAAFAFFAWRMMNKPSNVDFLIATDSEMKKVNWTSRKDLIGSTKVVIVFMFLIALILFLVDVVFSYFFYLIGVLKHSPFGGGGTIGGG
jgi:preprotein translocase SecE subunit